MSDYSANFPSQRPVFSQDFAQSGKIDPRATFSRSDSPIDTGKAAANAVHYWSNEKHLSSENLIPDSNASQAWQTVRVTRTTSGSFLDGSDSFLIAENSDTGSHYTSPNSGANATNFVSGTEYTAVVYAKAGTDNVIQLAFPAGYFTSNAYANFDLSNASTTPVTGSAATATITALGSDWVKLTLTAPATATGAAVGIVVAFIQNDINGARIPVYAGDTASNIYLWEANISSTGQKFLVETDGQIHRAYAPTLKSPAAAGDPRFEYDPETNVSRGCLIESQATNLVTNSEHFPNWSATRCQVESNVAIGPDGTLSADRIAEDASEQGSNSHYMQENFTTANGTQYTMSVYAKHGGGANRYCQLRVMGVGSGFAFANFDLINGSYVGGGGSIRDSYSISSVGSGWYRLTMTFTNNPSGGTVNGMGIILAAANSELHQYTSDDYSGFLLYGAQFETGPFASSYITTLLSAKTRAAESLSVATADIGYTGGDVSLVFEGDFIGDSSGTPHLFSLRTDASNRIEVFRNPSDDKLKVYAKADNVLTASATASASGIAANTKFKFSVAYGDDCNSSTDSDAGMTEVTGVVAPSSMSHLYIGYTGSSSHLDGHCAKIALYSSEISKTNLQALTS